MVELTTINIFVGLAFNGLFTGIGTALGVYFANKHIIQGSGKIINMVRGKNGNKTKED